MSQYTFPVLLHVKDGKKNKHIVGNYSQLI